MKKSVRVGVSLFSVVLMGTVALFSTGCSRKAPDEKKVESVSESVNNETESELTAEEVVKSKIEEKLESENKGSVTVDATYKVYVDPDIAGVTFWAEYSGKDRDDVEINISKVTSKIEELIKESGVLEGDYSIMNYGVEPVYGSVLNASTLTGYTSETMITVQNQPIDALGVLIQEAVNAGVTRVGRVSYKYSDYDKAYDEALTKATEEAVRKARVIAEAAGKTLVDDYVIIEGYSSDSLKSYAGSSNAWDSEASYSEGRGEYSIDLAPGKQEISAQVNLTCSTVTGQQGNM